MKNEQHASLEAHHLFQSRDTFEILKQASKDYCRYGWQFTQTILPSVLMIYGGCYGALLLSLSIADRENAVLKLGATLVALGVMFYGFWRFLVYMCSLNLSYARKAQQQSEFKADADNVLEKHKKPLLGYINGVVTVPLLAGVLFFILLSPLTLFFPPIIPNLLVQVLTLLAYAWVALGFQIIALANVSGIQPLPGLLGVLKQSRSMVKPHYGQCFWLLLASFVLTYYLIPGVVVTLAELSGAISWFNQLHQGLVVQYLDYLSTLPVPLITLPSPEDISHQISQQLLSNLVNSLLLPWGTFVCALLYGSIVSQQYTNTGAMASQND